MNDQNQKLKSILSTSALSVALISWGTTANGLYVYVFDYFWQAYIMSAALQGVLFALSIKGIDLFFQFKKIYEKGLLIVIWILLLGASSTFSYVYISRTVYSDKELEDDAKRVLNAYCLKENYELNSEIRALLEDSNGVRNSMDQYIQLLANIENGVEISDRNKEQLNKLLNKLNNDFVGKKYCPNTTILVLDINTILSGKYGENDIETLNNEIQNMLNAIANSERMIHSELNDKRKNVDKYQNRLKDFKSTANENYKDLKIELETSQEAIQSLENEERVLIEQKTCINQLKTLIRGLEGSIESDLYRSVLALYSEMNKEEINADNVLKSAEEIYDILQKNGVSANDARIVKYNRFRNDIAQYKLLITAQQLIDSEIKELYRQTEEEDTENSVDNIKIDTEELYDDEINESDNIEADKDWKEYWHKRLNSLKKSVQIMSQCGLNTKVINSLIENINSNERLYLSDLNDLERSFSLLFGKNPVHPYKTILKFSFAFSFGIDLLSILVSIIRYIVQEKHEEGDNKFGSEGVV